jgi:hypothetical protein
LANRQKNARQFSLSGLALPGRLKGPSPSWHRLEESFCGNAKISGPLIILNSYPRLLLPTLLISMLISVQSLDWKSIFHSGDAVCKSDPPKIYQPRITEELLL